MNNFVDLVFSPLGKEWCFFYFIILVMTFIALVGAIFVAIVSLFNVKKFTFAAIYAILIGVFFGAITYIQSRLIYSICLASLK
jgi:uncharacterized YccA/Bax inhibitor family protein